MRNFFGKKPVRILIIAVCLLLALALAIHFLIPVVQRGSYIQKYGQENYDRFRGLTPGSQVCFGAYEQDRNTENGPESIEWIVLCVEDDRAMLVSRYVLDCVPYSSHEGDVTWEKSYIRQWLNGKFLDRAFTEQEQLLIPQVQIIPDKANENVIHAGRSTYDQVFLLSYTEATRFFADNEQRCCQATAYARWQGVIAAVKDSACWWWLRSAGNEATYAAYVLVNGYAYSGGGPANTDYIGVRPAIWVELPVA